MLGIYDLRVLLVAAQTGSLSAAARQLGISQSTASRRVARVEKELGVRVFGREGRHATPTADGRRVLTFAETVVAEYARLQADLEAASPPVRGTIRIVTSTAPAAMMAELLAGFRDRHPDVSFDISVADSGAVDLALVENRAHVGFSGRHTRDQRLQHLAITVDEIVFIVPRAHPAAAIGSLTLEDLQRERLVRRRDGSGTESTVRDALGVHRVDLDELCCAVRVSSAEAVVDAVRAGLGIGAVSRNARGHGDGVVGVHLQDVDLTRPLWVVWLAAATQLEHVARFLKYVHEAATAPGG